MSNATVFKPRTERGADLAEYILDIIEEEHRRVAALVDEEDADWAEDYIEHGEVTSEINTWNQGSWAQVFVDNLPPNTKVEVFGMDDVKVRVSADRQDDWEYEDITGFLALDSGVSCGTASCFAGHAAFAVGDRFAIPVYDGEIKPLKRGSRSKNAKRVLRSFHSVDEVITAKGKIHAIEDRAAKLLGLDRDEANCLFNGQNGLDTLRRYVKMMKDGKHLVTGKKK